MPSRSQNYTWLPHLRPALGGRHDAGAGGAGGCLSADRHAFSLPGHRAINQVLATTELPSGVPLDNGTGWARLNLYAAAGGYGAFPTDVTVNMNAAAGGLNAFDIWSNAISGPGGLTLQGSGTLILAGNNTYTGGTTVQGGTLAVTGTLAGNLAVAPGASFVGNGGIGGSLALLAGSTFLAQVGANGANLIAVGGTATLAGGTLAVASRRQHPGAGQRLADPHRGRRHFRQLRFRSPSRAQRLAAGTRFDALYGTNTIALAVTPGSYGNLAAAGLAESSSESGVGAALDAIRPAPGTATGCRPGGAVRPALHAARRQHRRGASMNWRRRFTPTR